jgi:hypothetical protein
VAAGPLGMRIQVASQDAASFLLHMKASNAGTAGEDCFRAAYKIIGDAVAKSDLPQDVRVRGVCLPVSLWYHLVPRAQSLTPKPGAALLLCKPSRFLAAPCMH